MPSELLGKWKLVKSENFDEYMKEVEITEEGENMVRINTQSTFKSSNVLFPLGQEIDEHTMDGRNCKTVLTWDGQHKLVEIQKWDDGKKVAKLEWVYRDGKMILILEYKGVVSERTHERC